MGSFSQAFDSLTKGLLPTSSAIPAIPTTSTTTGHHRHHTHPIQSLVTKTSEDGQATSFTPSTTALGVTQSSDTDSSKTSASASATSELTKPSTSSTISNTSSKIPSQAISTTVPANPVVGPTNTSSASLAKHDDGSDVSRAGVAIGVILSLVVLCAMGFLMFRQRERFLACIARHRGRPPRDEEEVSKLEERDVFGNPVPQTDQIRYGAGVNVVPAQSNATMGASLDRPFSHPAIVDDSNHGDISPSISPLSGHVRNSHAISPLSPSQYKPWAIPYTYKPYTYDRSSSIGSPTTFKSQMGPPGRILPAYGKAKAKIGVWEADASNRRLLKNGISEVPPQN